MSEHKRAESFSWEDDNKAASSVPGRLPLSNTQEGWEKLDELVQGGSLVGYLRSMKAARPGVASLHSVAGSMTIGSQDWGHWYASVSTGGGTDEVTLPFTGDFPPGAEVVLTRVQENGFLKIKMSPDNIGSAWSASRSYSNGMYCSSTGPGDVYLCVTGGTSGASEPTWDTVIGNNTNDGTCIWERVSAIPATTGISTIPGGSVYEFETNQLYASVTLMNAGYSSWIIKGGMGTWYDVADNDPATRYSILGGSNSDAKQDNLSGFNFDGQVIDSLVRLDMFGQSNTEGLRLADGLVHRRHAITFDRSTHTLSIVVEVAQTLFSRGKAVDLPAGTYTCNTWTPASGTEDSQHFYWQLDFTTVTPATPILATVKTAASVRAASVYSNDTDSFVLAMDSSIEAVRPSSSNYLHKFLSGLQVVGQALPDGWSKVYSDSAVRFNIDGAKMLVRGVPVTVSDGSGSSSWEQELGDAVNFAEIPILHLTANGFKLSNISGAPTFPFLVGGSSILAYNSGTSQVEVSDGEFVPYFLVLTNCTYAPFVLVQGVSKYETLGDALQNYTWGKHFGSGITLPPGLLATVVGRFVFKYSAGGGGTYDVKIADFTDWRATPAVAMEMDSELYGISHKVLTDTGDDVHTQYAKRRPGVTLLSGSHTVDSTKDRNFYVTSVGSVDSPVTLPTGVSTGFILDFAHYENTGNYLRLIPSSGDVIFAPGIGYVTGTSQTLETVQDGSALRLVAYKPSGTVYWVVENAQGAWYQYQSGYDDVPAVYSAMLPSGTENNFITVGSNGEIQDSGYSASVRKVLAVSASTHTVNQGDLEEVLHVTYTGTGACTITLQTAWIGDDGATITIKDTGLNASVNNITVATQGTEKIEGSTSDAVINGDGDSITFQAYNGDVYII